MDILKKSSISTSQNLKSKEEATILAGKLLVEGEYVTKEYIDSIHAATHKAFITEWCQDILTSATLAIRILTQCITVKKYWQSASTVRVIKLIELSNK